MQKDLPHFTDINDSIQSAREYINNWIVQQLLVSEAELKLDREESEIRYELEKYQQEVLIYKYKNKKLHDIINHSVTEIDFLNYYTKNQDKFVLTQPVVKINYIIFPACLIIPANILTILSSNRVQDVEKCEKFILKNAGKFDNYKNQWIHFDDLLKSMHVSITDHDNFLKNHKIIEGKTGNDIHLVVIKQYYLSGEQAPMELIAPQIRGVVINKEKLDFLREIKDSLYKDALKYNKFKVFN